jgi:hypothetical protein
MLGACALQPRVFPGLDVLCRQQAGMAVRVPGAQRNCGADCAAYILSDAR